MACIRHSYGLWIARCMINYKYHTIGEYKSKQEAISAYNDYIFRNNLKRKILI